MLLESFKKNRLFLYKVCFDNYVEQYFVVDTGALNSAMPLELLFELLNSDVTVNYIPNKDKFFTVANNDTVKGYLCEFENVDICGNSGLIHLDTFYCYVLDTPNGNESTTGIHSLLGTCFLDNTTFYHNMKSNFMISSFDDTHYREDYLHIQNTKINLTTDNVNVVLCLAHKSIYLYECIDIKQENKQTYYNIRHIETAKTKWIDRKTFIEFKQKHSPCNDVKNIVIQTSEQGTTYARYVKGN